MMPTLRARLLLLLLLILGAPIACWAQATHVTTNGTLPAACSVGDRYTKTGTGAGDYTCGPTANTWVLVPTISSSDTLTNKTISGASNTLTNLPAANLTGSLPAISGALLTSLPAANLTGSYAALNGSAITALSAANLTGTIAATTQQAITETGILTGFRLGNNGPSLTSPTKVGAVNQLFSGALGSSVYVGTVHEIYFQPSGSWSGGGVSFLPTGGIVGTQNATSTYFGTQSNMVSSTTGLVNEEIGLRGQVLRAGGNTTTATGLDAYGSVTNGTLAGWFGLRAHAPTVGSGGAITTGYGLQIPDQSTGGCTACIAAYAAFPSLGRFTLTSSPALSNQYGFGSNAFSNLIFTASNSDLAASSYNMMTQTRWDFTPSADVTTPTTTTGLEAENHTLTVHLAHNIAAYMAATSANLSLDGVGNTTQAAGFYAELDQYGTTGTAARLATIENFWGTGAGSTTTLFQGLRITEMYEKSGTVGTAVGVDIERQDYSGADAWALRYTNASSQVSGSTAGGAVIDTPGTVTIGTTGTLTPSTTQVQLTCSDAGGCAITMGESGIKNGQSVKIVNVSANTANFADTSGVSELAGAFAMGQWDTLNLMYVVDRWVEQSRSNN